MPENPERAPSGNTTDDRMDIAQAIGRDLVPNLPLALEIAQRVLDSKWLAETLEVTDEMVEDACRVLLPVQPGVSFSAWARANGSGPVDQVRAALTAALGGGDRG